MNSLDKNDNLKLLNVSGKYNNCFYNSIYLVIKDNDKFKLTTKSYNITNGTKLRKYLCDNIISRSTKSFVEYLKIAKDLLIMLYKGETSLEIHDIASMLSVNTAELESLINAGILNTNLESEAGLHIHTGSEIKDVSVFMKVTDVFFDLVPKFPQLQFLDLGGGFKVPYKAGDPSTNINELATELQKFQEKLQSTYARSFELWFEPGKYMVSKAGYFITEVNVIKQTPSITFAGVNSGFNHLIRPMLYEAYHEIKNLTNPNGVLATYDVVGNICETDTFASDRKIPTISEGDLLVFENAGAYGFEMASNFNSRYKPAEVMIINGEAKLIRQRDTFEDLTRNQVEVL